jgi:hypothetical protein
MFSVAAPRLAGSRKMRIHAVQPASTERSMYIEARISGKKAKRRRRMLFGPVKLSAVSLAFRGANLALCYEPISRNYFKVDPKTAIR